MWVYEQRKMIEKLSYISKEYIAQFLPKNPIIVEAGANKGRDTIESKKVWPESTIYAFEPVPALYEQLKANTAQLSNVFCYSYALSDKTGDAIFYVADKNMAIGSLLEPALIKIEKANVHWHPIYVKTITLDDWAKQYFCTHIDLLWLDLQGAELAALKGAAQLLKTVRAIHCEVSLQKRYQDQALYDEICLFLTSHGFRLQAEALYRHSWGNTLFVS